MTLDGVRVKHGVYVFGRSVSARTRPPGVGQWGAKGLEQTPRRTGVGDNAHMDVGICLKRRLHPFTIT